MTSVGSPFAQSVTKSFTVIAASATSFNQEDFGTWLTAYPNLVTKKGNNYIVSGDFNTTVSNLANTGTGPSVNTTLKDFGQEIRIGNAQESSLLVFRLVQLPGTAGNNGYNDPKTSYVMTQNNASDVAGAAYKVYVARV